jgi:1,4-alpha-glucan branching enzyme
MTNVNPRVFANAFRNDKVLSVFAPDAGNVQLYLGLLDARGSFFKPNYWTILDSTSKTDGWWNFDIDGRTGRYEYGFALNNEYINPLDPIGLVVDPFAAEVVRFGGYRGVLYLDQGLRQYPQFDWGNDDNQDSLGLPQNEKLVIYELPLRWMAGPEEDSVTNPRQIGLGTFDKVLFERLKDISDLGVNAIELLPVADSADTLNWGYGTRFFFAPDLDMGWPIDLKLLIKRCHQVGIRVILDIVMNHARSCPLEQLAHDYFFLRPDEPEFKDRPSWGGKIFRYRTAYQGKFWSREFHYEMARQWIENYHIDGFRIDEFKGIDNWDFVREFRKIASTYFKNKFGDRPFIVIAENTKRDPATTKGSDDQRVVDAEWNFSYRDDARRLLRNDLSTTLDQPSRTDHVYALIHSDRVWDGYTGKFKDDRFENLTNAVIYLTSHDVEQEAERRLLNYFFQGWMGASSFNASALDIVKGAAEFHSLALQQIRSSFALLLTSQGIPMFLAGEEFADSHDLDPTKGALKMGDPVDFRRAHMLGHRELRHAVKQLIHLRTSSSALQTKGVKFLYFHSTFDDNDGERVFAYCRTNDPNLNLGKPNQVIVVANCSPRRYPAYDLKNWPWRDMALTEHGGYPDAQAPVWKQAEQLLRLSLEAFQVRVFAT